MPEPVDDPLREAGEAISGTVRTAAMAAGQILHVKLTRQAHADRKAALADQAEARATTQRLHAERATAATLYTPTRYSTWWQTTTPDGVAAAWDAAVAFEHSDPAAGRAVHDLRQGLHEHPDLARDLLAGRPDCSAAQAVRGSRSGTGGITEPSAAGAESVGDAPLAEPLQAAAVAELVTASFPSEASGPPPRLASAGSQVLDPAAVQETPTAVGGLVTPSFPEGPAEATLRRARALTMGNPPWRAHAGAVHDQPAIPLPTVPTVGAEL
jgi:hypothetical protein